ncbi:uncharacterized protein LOC119419012 [Nematolebias whitei]|uniref:uncharacterized protein LOC119419012 n=1 Tax=Nematolebias whitei TaxID=451745 RepID=UPI001896FC3C|nr:uncharacterized protein LOC119419012 [Nematolebias whitei]
MLRPLLLLFALTAVPGAAGLTFTDDREFNISSCPITYFGQTYDRVYVNVSMAHFVACFDGFYDPATSKDCVVGPKPDVTTEQEIVTSSMILQLLIGAKFNCYVSFALGNNTTDVMVNGIVHRTLSVTNSMANGQYYAFEKANSCRYKGEVYETATTTVISSTCETIICNATASLHVTTCGPMETCLGNNMCAITTTQPPTTTTTTPPPTTTSAMPLPVHSICTVTGPSVIDFNSQLGFVKDQCSYNMLTGEGISVVVNFLERRLTDVSFPDSVLMKVDGADILLKQGGRVLLNNSPLNLDSSPQVVNDVEISKDNTGVTARVQIKNLFMTIFFDGITVQILMEGSTGSPPTGLCEDSSSEARLPGCSSTSCVPQYDYAEDKICPNNTDSCFHLNKAPFTSCDINPNPYFEACTDTLSRYPAVDGLKCQFLEAYARACSLKSNITLKGWRSKTECRKSSSCYNTTCSDHEFCAEKSYGETRCFCRANFACELKNSFAYGHPPVCEKHHASLTLYNCLLEEENIDYTSLQLNDPTCRGRFNETDHTVTFTFKSDTCGTEIINNGSSIIYQNTIMNQNVTDIITRQDMVMIDISCYQTQPDILTKAFTVIDSSYTGIVVPGPWNYTLSIRAYIDDGCNKLVDSDTPIRLNQQVWVKLSTKWLDGDVLSLVTDHCWATDEPSPFAARSYDLVRNGCPADSSVITRENGKGTFNSFAFNMFEFSRGSNKIYLHCQVHLCVKTKENCAPVISTVTGLTDRLKTSMMTTDL